MPYDRQTCDLTAVLYALNQASNYSDISEPGKISIDKKDNSQSTSSKNGKHHYLSIRDEQISVTLDALIHGVIAIGI